MPRKSDEYSPTESDKKLRKKQKRKRIILCGFILLGVVCFILFLVLVLTYALRLHCPNDSPEGKDPNPQTGETKAGRGLVRFIHVSDIHGDKDFDKSMAQEQRCRAEKGNNTAAYEAPYGRADCDSPIALIDSAMKAMKSASQEASIQFIMISGDSAPHNVGYDETRIFQGIALISGKTTETFPDIPVFPVLGVSDLPGYFMLPTSSDWYEKTLSHWLPLITCSGCPDDVDKPTSMAVLRESFLEGGYYNASIADGKMVLLVLNTMYWHYRSNHDDPVVKKTAQGQFVWLESQLQLAKELGKKVLLMSHAPPGIDSSSFDPTWLPNYTKTYVDLIGGKYHDVVAGQFYGYGHRDDFRLQLLDTTPADNDSSKQSKSFALLAPSICPNFRNNPAFRVMSLDPEKQSLVDYSQYYLDLVMANEFSDPVWQFDYTFSEKYPSTNRLLDANRIDELSQQLIDKRDDTFWHAYVFSRQVNSLPDYYSRFALYCSARYVFEDDFKKCIGKFKVPGG